jgi:hypothetical protein
VIGRLEALGDRLLSVLVPRAQASASVLNCVTHICRYTCEAQSKPCYQTCCDNPGHPPSCGSCTCPAC